MLYGSLGEDDDDESKESGPDRDAEVEPTVDATDGLGDDESGDPLDQTTANTAVTSPDTDHPDVSDEEGEYDGGDHDQQSDDNGSDFSSDESPNPSDDETDSAEKGDAESASESDATETDRSDKTESEEGGHDPAGFM